MKRILKIGERIWWEDDHMNGWGTIALISGERDYPEYIVNDDEIVTIEKETGGEIEVTANRVYQLAPGRYFWGEEVVWEHHEDIDYPFFCPERYENCYHFEVESEI